MIPTKIPYFIITMALSGSILAQHKTPDLLEQLNEDGRLFYSSSSAKRMLGMGLISYTLAHSSADQKINDQIQNRWHSTKGDQQSIDAKKMGEWKYALPIALTAHWMGDAISPGVQQWGNTVVRSMVVGAPAVWGLQTATGASRPNENKGSRWHPFKDNNGVSGHAFVGAIPWIALAEQSDSKLVKIPAYAASTLAGLSRMYDGQHYASQVAFGWWMGYLAVESTQANNQTQTKRRYGAWTPWTDSKGTFGMVWTKELGS